MGREAEAGLSEAVGGQGWFYSLSQLQWDVVFSVRAGQKGDKFWQGGGSRCPFPHAQMWVASGGGCPVTCPHRPSGVTAFSSQHCAWCPPDKGAGD